MMQDFPTFEPGTVWLVGAGPGDPGLMTILAVHGLQQADIVVHDALVSPQILAMAPAGVELEAWGKRGGHHSPRQNDINERLIELAQQGKRVLRLKGGDPFVFGRGAEEALALAKAGIGFRVVPGITAGIGGLAYAGIPTTARDCNSSVVFITGHGQDGDVPTNFDWDSLARGAQVMVFYMALRKLDKVMERLLQAGRPADEPLAIVSKAATADQQVLVTTIGNAVADLADHPLPPPALMVVGPVVNLRQVLNWWQPDA